ncbi:hypothetical protein [Rhizobium leguminosarum]|uniref:hypothetical protein n=1 Tax=Rhizobium leguminosarum TaxID=384 RepID=UPI000B929F48|nr:hypothetical protein [Rhizobium leguminosarum]ASS55886.1 hypothetical protein CHR56_15665 [Rhizobium leguminosarum bv. viciae]
MTRDEARATWQKACLTFADLTLGRLQTLRDMIDSEMRASGLFVPSDRTGGTYRMHKAIDTGLGTDGWWASLQCMSYYFKNREAVTFNGNGFIGFAGWSDDHNVQPILSAFTKWVRSLPTTNTTLDEKERSA